jgi:hypothetical protein
MDDFYVRALVLYLYIGHEMPFCKKCTIYTMLNIYIYIYLPLELSPSKSNENPPSNSGHLKIL